MHKNLYDKLLRYNHLIKSFIQTRSLYLLLTMIRVRDLDEM